MCTNDRKYGYLKSTTAKTALFSSVTPTLFRVHARIHALKKPRVSNRDEEYRNIYDHIDDEAYNGTLESLL